MAEPLDVHMLTLGPLQANCFVLVRGQHALAIDPGDEADVVISVFTQLGVAPAAVLVTHGHFDHCGAVAAVARHFGAPVYFGTADAAALVTPGSSLLPTIPHKLRLSPTQPTPTGIKSVVYNM